MLVRTVLRRRRPAAVLAGVVVLSAALAGCQKDSSSTQAGPREQPSASGSASSSPSPSSQVQVRSNVARTGVRIDRVVRLTAEHGTFDGVTVMGGGAKLAGALSEDKTTWTASAALEPGTKYRVHALTTDDDGRQSPQTSSFRTQALSMDQQTYPSFAPLNGETVGVGMPVIVHFDVPVTDKASIEKHLKVKNTSGQKGAWHWISDTEVHWRPTTYWRPGTDVTVSADVNSVPAGNGVYGQLDRSSTFHVGSSVISKVNVKTHRMKVYVDGQLKRTIPVSAGKPGFITRSGVKVIVEKFKTKHMDAATTGISKDDPEYYDLSDVKYAMRVTYSGEFIHAAPWSVGSQGSANVSHGCVGMSTENAKWLFDISKRGDVVDVTGSDRHMTLTNGYGDWNLGWNSWEKGSAL